jgi:hypothetical protein
MHIRIIFIISCTFFILVSSGSNNSPEQTTWTVKDENLAALIIVNGMNLKEAKDSGCAAIIEPDGRVDFDVSYAVVGEYPISLTGFKIIYVQCDVDTFSSTQTLNIEGSPGSNGSITQSINLEDYLGFGDLQFVSGIYTLRIEIYYDIEGRANTLRVEPFYVRLRGNPMTTIMGGVATAGLVYSGISIISLAYSVKKSIAFELDRSIKSAKVSPTDKLISYYKGKTAKKAQGAVSKQLVGYIRGVWGGKRCPSCSSNWPEGQKTCLKCGINLIDAEKLYSEFLGEKCLKACEELGVSVSGYSVGKIAQNLSEGLPVATDIISVLVFSGLAIVEPHIGTRLQATTRKLVFTGLSTCVTVLFWIQACGLEAISLQMLIIAIITGTILPMVISRVIGKRIHSAIHTFWKKKLRQT